MAANAATGRASRRRCAGSASARASAGSSTGSPFAWTMKRHSTQAPRVIRSSTGYPVSLR